MTPGQGEDSWSIAGDIPDDDPVDDSWAIADSIPTGTPAPPSEPGLDTEARRRRTPKIGETFGAYEVLAKLGSGGMGVVFRARERSGDREVALKILSAHRMSARQIERFRREGEMTATLRHPGIVRIHAGGEIDGLPYLAYELIEGGGSLSALLGDMQPMRMVALLRDVAVAVGHAHAHGVVHRDLKPDNVLIDAAGVPRVADFGLARAEGQDRLTRTGAMVGTPAFMAPEQFNTELGEVGPWTDVWALGVMLYHGLTGAPPFQASTLVELAARVCQSIPDSPRDKNPDVSVDLEAICLKALERDAERRYRNAEEMAKDLGAVLAEQPVSASAIHWRWRRRKRTVQRGAVAALLLAVLAGLGLLLGPDAQQRQELEAARLLEEARRGTVERDELEAALVNKTELGPESRGALHLALALGAADDAAGWRARAQHAEQAARLTRDDARRAEALRAQGRALLALGEASRAAEALARAVDLAQAPGPGGAGPRRDETVEILLELGRAQLAAGRYDAALGAGERALRQRAKHLEAMRVVALAHAGLGRAQQAEKTARAALAANPGPDANAVLAETLDRIGQDPTGILRNALESWPEHDRLRLVLAEHLFLTLGEARAAARVLIEQTGKRSLRNRQLLRALSDLGCLDRLGTPPRIARVRDVLRRWLVAAARWLLVEARRELAFLERLADPFAIRHRDALGPEERRARVRNALEAALELCGGDHAELRAEALVVRARLAGPTTPAGRADLDAAAGVAGGWPEYRLLRAEEQLSRGVLPRPGFEALHELEPGGVVPHERLWLARARAALASGDADAALASARKVSPWFLSAEALDIMAEAETKLAAPESAQSAAEHRERAHLLRERPHRQDSAVAFRARPSARRDAALQVAYWERVAARDPAWVRGRYEIAKARYKLGEQRDGLRMGIWSVTRDPRILSDLSRDMMVVAFTTPSAADEAMPWLLKHLEPLSNDRIDLLIRALVRQQGVEIGMRPEDLPPALEAADAAIAGDPSNPIGYVLRAFLHLRARHPARAERDLAIAADETPDCSVLIFYQALVAAAAGNGPRARERLAQIDEESFEPLKDNAWSQMYYPEVDAFQGKPGFEIFQRHRPRRD